MSELGQNLKNIVMKGIEAFSNTAESIATNTKQKVDEFNLQNRMKDIFAVIGEEVYKLFKNGTSFPDEILPALRDAAEAEKELSALREQKPDSNESFSADDYLADDKNPTEDTSVAEYTAGENNDVPVLHIEEEENIMSDFPENKPLSSAINDLFENTAPVEKMVDRVNSSLDDLGNSLLKFSGDFGKQLNEFADQMIGENDDKQQ